MIIHRTRDRVALSLLLALTVGAVLTAPRSAAEPSPANTGAAETMAGAPAELSPEVRRLLRPRMTRHAKDLADIYGSMRRGELELVARLASAIADEPRIARPTKDAQDTLNQALPARFFVAQDALAERAGALAAAAKRGDVPAARAAFDAMTAECLGCHARYMPIETP